MDARLSKGSTGPVPSLTTRRGFIGALSFGVVSLYGLWAALGVAPIPFLRKAVDAEAEHEEHGAADSPPSPAGGGHAEHGSANGPSVEEFRTLTDEFIARHRQADGSVRVGRSSVAPAADPHAAHGTHEAMQMPMPAATTPDEGSPVDVYLVAFQWGFEPADLRLDVNVPYRFRMMAVDASHGVSLQVGRGSRIMRLRRGAVTEHMLTFTQPGEYLVYCTVYCGLGHDRMTAKITVA